MASTLTVLTLQLAQAIGLYALAAGILLVTRPDRLGAILDDMERSAGLTYAFGLAAFAIGIAILIPHHVTGDPLGLVVTLGAVGAIAEGLLLIAVPSAFFVIARPFVPAARLWGVAAVVIGIVLFLAGLTGRADAIS